MRDQIDASHNPVVQRASQVADKILSETGCALAITHMKKYDPEFDIEELQYEAEEIFKEFYCNYLTGNVDYLDMVCGSQAGALCKAMIEIRQKQGWVHKYEELLNIGNIIFMGGKIENNTPMFSYHLEV